MKKVFVTLLLVGCVIFSKAQFTTTAVTSGTCTPATGNPTSDIVNTQATLNRIGHLESGTYGTTASQWSAIGIPNLATATPNSCDIYGFAANWDSDRFFCGLKNVGSNRKDALIGWGSHDATNGPDRLIFSFFNSASTQNNANGFEVATIYPNGRLGVGSTFQPTSSSSQSPQAKLEVLDNTGLSQLRLSYTQPLSSPFLTNSVYTDIQTTSNGDLFINPIATFFGAPSLRFVGIGTNAPSQRLDVVGTIRLRNLPPTPFPNAIITGIASGSDYVLNRLNFPGSTTQVLLGNGTFGNIPTTTILADNGLMNTLGTIQLGQANCASSGPGQLTRNTYIPMNDKDLVFTDAGSSQLFSTNRIGIGTPCTATPAAKVEILRPLIGAGKLESNPIALKVTNTDEGVGDPGQQGSATSIVSICNGLNRENTGGLFLAQNAAANSGVYTIASGYDPTNLGYNYGGQFYAINNEFNVGVNGNAILSGSIVLVNTGVRGLASGASVGNIGIYGYAPTSGPGTNYAGYFQGNVMINGTTTGTSAFIVSDQKFKKDILTVKNGLEIIRNINATKYNYDKESFKMMNFPETSQYGFIAQNLEKYAPELVADQTIAAQYDDKGNKTSDEVKFKAVNYIQIIPLLTSAVQELDEKISTPNKALETELTDLKAKYNQLSDLLNEICNNGCDNLRTPTTGSVKPGSVLFQNIPNPFTNSTVINYSIAEGAEKAEMLLSDLNGKPVKTVALELTKQGTLSVTAENLSAGTFTYSLIVDGRLIDTKKMMLTGN